jgi:CheY-like chemotaxis protein
MTTTSIIPKRILVVEDEEYLRDLYVQILKQEGYEVDQAVDGDEAMKKLCNEEYDLILLDIILPKLDGLQVLDKCKKQQKDIHDKVVLLTNLSQDLVIAKAVDYGVRGYMVKSDVTPPDIVTEVKNYLQGKKSKSSL